MLVAAKSRPQIPKGGGGKKMEGGGGKVPGIRRTHSQSLFSLDPECSAVGLQASPRERPGAGCRGRGRGVEGREGGWGEVGRRQNQRKAWRRRWR